MQDGLDRFRILGADSCGQLESLLGHRVLHFRPQASDHETFDTSTTKRPSQLEEEDRW